MKFFRIFDRFLLRSRLIISFSLLVAASLIILGTICYEIFSNKILSKSMDYNLQITDQISNNVDLYFSGILNVASSLSYNSDIKYYGNYFTKSDKSGNIKDISTTLFNIVAEKPDIDNIGILYNGTVLISTYNTYNNLLFQKNADYYNLEDIYLNAKIVPFSEKNKIGEYTFAAVKSVYTPNERDSFLSIVEVNFKFDRLDTIFNNLRNKESMSAYITNSKGVIQYAADKSIIHNNVFEKSGYAIPENLQNSIVDIGKDQYVVSVSPLSNTDMYIVTTEPLKDLTSAAQSIKDLTMVFILLFLIIAVIISVILSSAFTKPLMNLVERMEMVAFGKFDTFKALHSSPEIQILFGKFNTMTVQINQLMIDINEKNRLKRKAELFALQSQIKPHFLYNTLNTITSMSVLSGNREITKMTTSLAKLLRLSLNMLEFIKIRDELQHVKYYINIQAIRYKDKFDVCFDVPEAILDYDIVKLILQPLVENSISHGFETKHEKGHIVITGCEEGNNIRLSVIDNGIGMNEDVVDNINERLSLSTGFSEQQSIGIYNVNARIKLYYGESYGLFIKSRKNEGTTADILLPKKKEWIAE
ncbi:sensor histidine kinase YesM [Anaerobacterium chartisolvens]|uniref:Sensor histidine kinase YesM n=1 Tax=Anaerobacterium chartisolvens TaxID=1297424 RepID=A0A369B7N9_9FIRM|nr:sensor histidine kinase [Anaerobacterium chartisolvens]RCX17530.1 sensor histidine kinase YesM [Anaerobacterium chartisolvens]